MAMAGLFLFDTTTNTLTQVTTSQPGEVPSINANGTRIAFALNGNIFLASCEVSVTQAIDAGGTVTTAPGPTEASVTTPNAGTVSITEENTSQTPPTGFQLLNWQIDITAPAATASSPLIIVFQVDSSQIPPGENEQTIAVFKDGVQVPGCTAGPATASPDPCISQRALLPGGDVQLTVLTSTASVWNFGVKKPTYQATVQQPVNSNGTSVFSAKRGAVPAKFTLTVDEVPTCQLPPATIALTRTAGETIGAINESVYSTPADSGTTFRISDCQYLYNIGASALGTGTYQVRIKIGGSVVGSAIFKLK